MAVVQYTFTHKQYIERHKTNNAQNNTILEECGPCPVFAGFTLEFALQLRKKARINLSQGSQYEYMIYLLTAIGLSSGGSSTVHIYTQTIRRTTQITTNVEECGPCPVFASFTLAFALQLRKKHGKTSVRVAEEENGSIHITKTPTHYKPYTHTHIHIHKHTLQTNLKTPHYSWWVESEFLSLCSSL